MRPLYLITYAADVTGKLMVVGLHPLTFIFPICGWMDIIAVVTLTRWLLPGGLDFGRPMEIGRFFVGALVGAPWIGAFFAAMAFSVFGRGHMSFLGVMLSWWSSNSLGLLVILPVALAFQASVG